VFPRIFPKLFETFQVSHPIWQIVQDHPWREGYSKLLGSTRKGREVEGGGGEEEEGDGRRRKNTILGVRATVSC
jgi:hypothetical protein